MNKIGMVKLLEDIYVDEEILEMLQSYANKKGITISDIVSYALDLFIDEEYPKVKKVDVQSSQPTLFDNC